MKRRTLSTTLNIALSEEQRSVIQKLADSGNLSLGGAARELLAEGMRTRGLA